MFIITHKIYLSSFVLKKLNYLKILSPFRYMLSGWEPVYGNGSGNKGTSGGSIQALTPVRRSGRLGILQDGGNRDAVSKRQEGDTAVHTWIWVSAFYKEEREN